MFFPAVELATILFPAAMIAAGLCDAETRIIPNSLVLGLVVGFAALAPLAGFGPAAMALHFGVALLALAAGFGLFAAGWLGGGDGKLIAATALWLGPAATIDFVLVAALAGGALAMGLLAFRMQPMPPVLVTREWAMALHAPDGPVPYGIALAAGGLAAFTSSPWIAGL